MKSQTQKKRRGTAKLSSSAKGVADDIRLSDLVQLVPSNLALTDPALGGFAAARSAGNNAPLRHAVTAAMALAFLGMLIGALQPLGLAAVADLLVTTGAALGAAWWGTRAARKRIDNESEQD